MARTLAMFTDTSLCIGCRACQVACKQWNELGLEVPEWTGGYQNHAHFTDKTYRLVRFVEAPGAKPNGDLAWLLMSDVCKHCAQAGCLDACPTGAIYRTEFGTVNINQDVCNGCRYCVASCPFGVVSFNEQTGTAKKCTFCNDRIHNGLGPACAKACPTDSIQFGFRDELVAKANKRVETLKGMGFKDAQLYGADSGGLLLIADLGVPARFMNMILHFKFWDPMSIGAWAVGVFGGFTFVSSVLSFTSSDSLASLRRKISLVGMLFGFFLAGYTGVLLSNSAMPFWGDSRLMGALFLASGASTGMAAVALIMFLSGGSAGEGWHKIEVADRFSMIVEVIVLGVFLALLGSAARPITSGHFGPLFWGGLVGAGLILPLVLNFFGGRVRALGAVSAALVLMGGFILRYVVVMSIQG